MKYNLLVVDKSNNKETLLDGFKNEQKVIDFCNKYCIGFKGFDAYSTAYNVKFKQNKGEPLDVDLSLQGVAL